MPVVKIKQSYFDNIKLAIDCLNKFFESDFKDKDFPVLDGEVELDRTIEKMIEWINCVNVNWINDFDTVNAEIEEICDTAEEMGDDAYARISQENPAMEEKVNSFIGYKMLQLISDNFDQFSNLLNGIYSFDIFLHPSQYQSCIDIFGKPVDINEIEIMTQDESFYLFNKEEYIKGLFEDDDITFSDDVDQEAEQTRFDSLQDSSISVTVVKDGEEEDEDEDESSQDNQETQPENDQQVQQEFAYDTYYTSSGKDIQYDPSEKKFHVSDQLSSEIDRFISKLSECDSTEDIASFIYEDEWANTFKKFADNVIPFVLAKSFTNTNASGKVSEYVNLPLVYFNDVAKHNPGAARFNKYDLFSVFKIDKAGTIKFISDFLKLELYNNDKAYIRNNTLSTIFDLYDAKLYFGNLYNKLDEKAKKNFTEEAFIRKMTAKVHRGNTANNPYEESYEYDTAKIMTASQVSEFTSRMNRKFGNMSEADLTYCEAYTDLCKMEIANMPYLMSKSNVSNEQVAEYISEAFMIDFFDSYYTEYDASKSPKYLADRFPILNRDTTAERRQYELDQSLFEKQKEQMLEMQDRDFENQMKLIYGDDAESSKRKRRSSYDDDDDDEMGKDQNEIEFDAPDFMKQRMLEDKLENDKDTTDEEDAMINALYKEPQNDVSDLAKSIKAKMRYAGNNKHSFFGAKANGHNDSVKNNFTKKNNTNNSIAEFDTTESRFDHIFAFLEADSGEPLSNNGNTSVPKGDATTTMMDVDRKTLPFQQKFKRGMQKIGNTGKAIVKPVGRLVDTVKNFSDKLFEKDKNEVKNQIMNDGTFRSTLKKMARIALKVGMFSVFTKISGLLAAGYAAWEIAKAGDTTAIRKEIQADTIADLKICEDELQSERDPNKRKELIRTKEQLLRQYSNSTKQYVRRAKDNIY